MQDKLVLTYFLTPYIWLYVSATSVLVEIVLTKELKPKVYTYE